MKCVAAATVLACLITTTGFAQDLPARTQDADEIRRTLKYGLKVTVTNESGRRLTGTIYSLQGDNLTIVVAGRQVDVPYAQIVRVHRRGDNVIDGAVIGFGVGATLGYVASRPDETHRDCQPADWFCGWSGPDISGYVALIGGGIGAAAGTVIDLLIPGSREVYRRPGVKRIAVAPTLSRSARGVLVSVGW